MGAAEKVFDHDHLSYLIECPAFVCRGAVCYPVVHVNNIWGQFGPELPTGGSSTAGACAPPTPALRTATTAAAHDNHTILL